MSTYKTNYGTYQTGKPTKDSHYDLYTRKDLYTGNDGYTETVNVFCIDASDNSPWQMEQETSKCGTCWHGFTHTTRKHNHNVENGLT